MPDLPETCQKCQRPSFSVLWMNSMAHSYKAMAQLHPSDCHVHLSALLLDVVVYFRIHLRCVQRTCFAHWCSLVIGGDAGWPAHFCTHWAFACKVPMGKLGVWLDFLAWNYWGWPSRMPAFQVWWCCVLTLHWNTRHPIFFKRGKKGEKNTMKLQVEQL